MRERSVTAKSLKGIGHGLLHARTLSKRRKIVLPLTAADLTT